MLPKSRRRRWGQCLCYCQVCEMIGHLLSLHLNHLCRPSMERLWNGSSRWGWRAWLQVQAGIAGEVGAREVVLGGQCDVGCFEAVAHCLDGVKEVVGEGAGVVCCLEVAG